MGSFPILCLDDIHLIYTELLIGGYSAGISPPPAETGGISRSSGGGCVYKFDGQVITPFVRSRGIRNSRSGKGELYEHHPLLY